ncbi:metallophosphoesterase [Gordonia sp. VNK1]|uniref:metallophosphoesterase family protein n=1 Tax=Gordonia oleivorans TaxID=3156618 RepID=UPI0032B49C23
MTLIAFGDWHGNALFAADALDAAPADDDARLIHVGDFGLWSGSSGQRYLRTVAERLGDRTLYVIPGNHEYWPGLTLGDKTFGFSSVDADGFLRSRRHPSIRVATRTNVWEWDGAVFASLAGANSIDRDQRRAGVSWWPEESPTADDVESLIGQVEGRDVDVFITHDAPDDAITELNLYPASRAPMWSPRALAYAQESAAIVGVARSALRPRLQICGHHHVRRTCTVGVTRVEFLADDMGTLRDNRIEVGADDLR